MKRYSKKELQEIISRDYGFKKKLIEKPEVCGLWQVRFEVRGIRYCGSTPYHGAVPRLMIEGYAAKHTWHGVPITDEYYEEVIEGHELVLIHCVDFETGDWGWEPCPERFDTVDEVEKYIAGLEHPEMYSYDIDSEK